MRGDPAGLPDYPFDAHFADVAGHRMHYLDEGPTNPDAEATATPANATAIVAPPVVMVHGNPSWSFYYRKLVLALRDDRRCLVPDHIGMGRSDKPAVSAYPYTLAQRIDDLETWLDAVDGLAAVSPIDLVVHDWGGMIGFGYAVRHPERIRRLVVLNTSAFRLPSSKRMPWQLTAARWPWLGAMLVRGLNLFCRGAATDGMTRTTMPPDVRAGYLAPYDTWAHRVAVHRFVLDIPLSPSHPTWELVADIESKLDRFRDTPMLLAWGMRDFVFDRHFLAGWTERFPDAAVGRFDDAGHYVLEDAADQVIPLITRFLHAG